MNTIGNAFVNFKQALSGIYDANEVEALTLLILSEITGWSKAKIKAFPEQELSTEQSERCQVILARLQTGEPIQYILGYTDFHGLTFKVNPSVLIPRPETEELVEWVISVCSGQFAVGNNILDIGTGSGCIAISLKKNLPGANVSAIDISLTALETAKENAKLNEVKVNFVHDDILNPINQSPITNHYSLIISNPPYVTQYDKTQMHQNVTGFEPHTALFVPEDDPLLFYRAIADFALKNLIPGGMLFFEINESLGKETVELLEDKGFMEIELRKDMSGRDRMVKAHR